jgi:hypothetical protein
MRERARTALASALQRETELMPDVADLPPLLVIGRAQLDERGIEGASQA